MTIVRLPRTRSDFGVTAPPLARGAALIEERRFPLPDSLWAQELDKHTAEIIGSRAPASMEMLEAICGAARSRLDRSAAMSTTSLTAASAAPSDTDADSLLQGGQGLTTSRSAVRFVSPEMFHHPYESSPDVSRADHLWDAASPWQQAQLFRLDRLRTERAERRRRLADAGLQRTTVVQPSASCPKLSRKTGRLPPLGSQRDLSLRRQSQLNGSSGWWRAVRGVEESRFAAVTAAAMRPTESKSERPAQLVPEMEGAAAAGVEQADAEVAKGAPAPASAPE